MHILFVADPLASFKIYKDTTFAMMREAQRRGHQISVCEPKDLRWQTGEQVTALVTPITLTGDATDWFSAAPALRRPLQAFDAVIMRKDPPFDSEYFYSTHLLEQAEREGARVFNKPRALRDHPEKLAILEFAQFSGPTLVTRSADDIKRFHAEHQDIILKPLDGMGGMGIFRVKADGLNLGSIIETLNKDGAQSVMVQSSARDQPGRQTCAGHRRQTRALQPGTYSPGQRGARQPGGRRPGCGAKTLGP